MSEAENTAELTVKARRTWLQRLLLLLGLLLSLLSFTSAALLGVLESKVSRVQRIALEDVLTPRSTPQTSSTGQAQESTRPTSSSAKAINILVIGVDNADSLAPDDRRRIDRDDGLRSDTIMVLRLNPSTGSAALLSFPRDLWLPLGGNGDNDRINAALPLGGPELLIRTITENFGIPIHHFAGVDFGQFQALVDAIGGVPFPFAYPVRDDNSGLYVGEPGCVLLDGSAALDYVRSRYLQRLIDGEWEADLASDLSRINRQQDFLRRAFARAKDRGLANPISTSRLIDAAVRAVTVDSGFGVDLILQLALKFRGLDPAALPAYAIPTTPEVTAGGADVLLVSWPDAMPVLDMFRGIDPFVPSAVRVRIVASDGGAALGSSLARVGFPVLQPVEAVGIKGSGGARAGASDGSEIRFAPADRYRAELLQRWLAGPVSLVEDDGEPTGVVQLHQHGPLIVRAAAEASTPRWTIAARASDGFLPAVDAANC